jgi:membrane-bound lytic murein transglycosylase D
MILAVSLTACATQRGDPPESAIEAATTAAQSPGKAQPPSRPDAPAKSPSRAPRPLDDADEADDRADQTEEFEGVLVRLREGYGFPLVDNDAVRGQAEWFVRNPRYLERVFERARPYLPHVADEIAARGLPAELAYLPVIESAFDPFAYSHGRAAGLWQFIPATGKRFGLKQNWWYDGRRDVVESTRAALEYLEYLHGMFDGDWLLAVAAYNAGEGTVGRAIRNNRAAGQPTDFWHLRLPAETRNYVPKLLGLAIVLSDPEQHAVSLPEIPNGTVFAAVELDGQIDLAVAARLAGIELDALQALNPGFNRWATDPDGPHRLQLPVEAVEPFYVGLADLPASERMRWHRHQVRPGDTLGGLARQHRTTVEAIQRANNLSGTTIRVGGHLMIPTATRDVSNQPRSAADAGRPARAKDAQVRRVNYTVRRGDSLYRIANNFRVTVADIRRWNNLDANRYLQPGQRLVLHVDVTAQSGG